MAPHRDNPPVGNERYNFSNRRLDCFPASLAQCSSNESKLAIASSSVEYSRRLIVANPYTAGVFSSQAREGGRSSAQAILPAIMQAIRPRSVVDVGCGTGTWLSVVRAAGVEDILGLDAGWVRPEWLEIPPDRFQVTDLRQPLRISRRFDLALCMEVAEHLPAQRSAGLVNDLVRLADVVLFSAALPGQGGTDHINEQWPDFWAELFGCNGYECYDAIRWRHWTDEKVKFWYAQNAFLYVAEEREPLHLAVPDGVPLRVVHPEVLTRCLDPQFIPWRLAVRALAWRVRGATKNANDWRERRR